MARQSLTIGQTAQAAGLTRKAVRVHLDDVREVLEIRRGGTPPCDAVRSLLDARIAEIDTTVNDLLALRQTLTETRQAADDRPCRSRPPSVRSSSLTARLLDGVRVLDLTNVLAGLFAAYQLALLGADVVKVEIPGVGDLARQLGADRVLNEARLGASFLAQNSGKRSMTVNLKSERGRQVLLRAVARADVGEFPARGDGPARRGVGGAARSQPAPGVLRDFRLRPGQAAA